MRTEVKHDWIDRRYAKLGRMFCGAKRSRADFVKDEKNGAPQNLE